MTNEKILSIQSTISQFDTLMVVRSELRFSSEMSVSLSAFLPLPKVTFNRISKAAISDFQAVL